MTEIPSELEMTQRPQQPIEKVSALSLGIFCLRRSYSSAEYFRLARPFQRQGQALANTHT